MTSVVPQTPVRLRAIPREMARDIRPLFIDPTRVRYVRFVQTMYHYTRYSGEELRYASEQLIDDGLRETVRQLAREEAQHYRLAEADLRSLGVPTTTTAPPSVVAFRHYLMSLTRDEGFQYLGILFALESVAQWVAQDAMHALALLGLTSQQTRFVRTHLQADDKHGETMARACTQHFAQHGPAIITGAQCAAAHWTTMHLSTLEAPKHSVGIGEACS